MGNVLFQIIGKYSDVEVEVIPGVTAVNYAAGILGAPLHDFAVISFSDILTPISEIKERLKRHQRRILLLLFTTHSVRRELNHLRNHLKFYWKQKNQIQL